MQEFANRIVVVTGGGKGIGEAIAKKLAGMGATLIVAGRDSNRLEQVAAQIVADGGRAYSWVCDVTQPASVDHLAEFTRSHGAASIVVNNAGVARSAKFADTDEALWQSTMEVNLSGAYRVTRAFLPDVLAAGKKGRILFIASVAAKIGFPYTAAYCASKHGLLGLSRSLAHELVSKGTTVNCVCPGWVDTDMAQAAIDRIAKTTGRSSAEARGELEKMSPQRRLVAPEEVASVVAFLASDQAVSITGQAWNVDGGEVMY